MLIYKNWTVVLKPNAHRVGEFSLVCLPIRIRAAQLRREFTWAEMVSDFFYF